jgi:YegS/Rv2252/BmrU family lipid kinase
VTTLTVVANPAAGGGRTARALPKVEAALRSAGHDVCVERTRDIDHAEPLATEAVAAGRVVVAFGGDGLVGRVAGAVAGAGGVLAVLPGGRGNDFARVLGIPRDPVAACLLLDSPRTVRLDLGQVDGRSFVGIASFGFDSAVQEIANATSVPLGQAVYLVATLRALLSWRHATYTVALDGVPRSVTGWSVAVANTGVYGGGMRLAPDASLTDGRLDVVFTERTGRLRFLTVLPRVFTGAHVRDPSVTIVRAAAVQVSADRPFRVYADGDPIGALPCEIRVDPGVLETVVPPSWTSKTGLAAGSAG